MTSREELLQQLKEYGDKFPGECDTVSAFSHFVAENQDCYERSNLTGHLTASAWITDNARKRAVLLHHAKLGKWMQPGGHADGDSDLIAVARKEAQEETGLEGLKLRSGGIYDLDIHQIPARGDVPEHFHYDVRFHFEAPPECTIRKNHESNNVEWVPLRKLSALTEERSVLRMVEKV